MSELPRNDELMSDVNEETAKTVAEAFDKGAKALDMEPTDLKQEAGNFLGRLMDSFVPRLKKTMTSPSVQAYGTLIKEVGLQEAEARFSKVLLDTLWGLTDKLFNDKKDNKVIKWLFYSTTGRTVVIAVISVPLSNILLAQSDKLAEKGDIYRAKLCIAIARVVSRMAIQQGMEVLDLDGWVDKLVGCFEDIMKKNNINPETLANSVDMPSNKPVTNPPKPEMLGRSDNNKPNKR